VFKKIIMWVVVIAIFAFFFDAYRGRSTEDVMYDSYGEETIEEKQESSDSAVKKLPKMENITIKIKGTGKVIIDGQTIKVNGLKSISKDRIVDSIFNFKWESLNPDQNMKINVIKSNGTSICDYSEQCGDVDITVDEAVCFINTIKIGML